MMSLSRLFLLLGLLCISFYTASYGVWTWKKQNKSGAVMIFVVAIATILLPIYTLWIREA